MPRVLGISCFYHDAAAAIVGANLDGAVVGPVGELDRRAGRLPADDEAVADADLVLVPEDLLANVLEDQTVVRSAPRSASRPCWWTT